MTNCLIVKCKTLYWPEVWPHSVPPYLPQSDGRGGHDLSLTIYSRDTSVLFFLIGDQKHFFFF